MPGRRCACRDGRPPLGCKSWGTTLHPLNGWLSAPPCATLRLWSYRLMIRLSGLRCRARVRPPGFPRCFWDRASSAMKVTVERSHLLKSLGHVHRVVERRNTIPILANVLVRAEGAQADAEGDRPRPRGDRDACRPKSRPAGATTVPAHILYDIVRKLPDGAAGRRWTPTATAPCWRSAPAARASRCRCCRRPISPISPPATCRTRFALAGERR